MVKIYAEKSSGLKRYAVAKWVGFGRELELKVGKTSN